MTDIEQKVKGCQKLLAIQAELPAVLEARTKGHHGKYLSLPDLLTAVRPVLNKHQVVLTQTGEIGDGEHVLVTKLLDTETAGVIERSEWPLSEGKGKTADQDIGKSMTYARRYALLGLLGICADDEDPDDKAKPRVKSKPAPAVPTQQATAIPQNELASKSDIDAFIAEASKHAETHGKEQVGAILAEHRVIKSTLPNWRLSDVQAARKALAALTQTKTEPKNVGTA